MQIYATLCGIKTLNITTHNVVNVQGVQEAGERFLSVALYQGVPKVDTQLLLARTGASSAASAAAGGGGRDG